MGRWRRHVRAVVLAVALLALTGIAAAQQSTDPGRAVLAVEVTGTIDPGLAALIDSAVRRTEQEGYRALVLLVDTPGGLVQSAVRIRDTLLQAGVPTIAFIQGRAISAGALISLAAERIYMVPGASIGDAEPIPYSDKSVAFVRAEFESTAEVRQRDARVAAAMVDKGITIENVTTGKPLTLTYTRAAELGISDGTVADLDAALAQAGLADTAVERYVGTTSDRVGRMLTNPYVAGLLLLLGIGALVWEFVQPGLGVPGFVGITSLAAFLGGHYLVGTAGWVELGLVGLGVILLAVELFVPGFGIFGIGGVVSVAAGIFMMAPSPQRALIYLSIVAAGALAFLVVFVRYLARHGLGRWLTLESKQESSAGYLPERSALAALVGQTGVLVTPCRPAGTAEFDTERVDVVSEGGFLPTGQRVTIVRVEGTRVVVRPVREPDSGGTEG